MSTASLHGQVAKPILAKDRFLWALACLLVKTNRARAFVIRQAEQMDKLDMEVIPVGLRDAYAFGGGLHCCTADVYREGGCEDYFPVG